MIKYKVNKFLFPTNILSFKSLVLNISDTTKFVIIVRWFIITIFYFLSDRVLYMFEEYYLKNDKKITKNNQFVLIIIINLFDIDGVNLYELTLSFSILMFL